MVHAQQRSGLSVAAFCRTAGLNCCSFYSWRKRIESSAAPAPRFIQARILDVARDDLNPCLELRLPRGVRTSVRRGFDPQLLADVVDALSPEVAS